MDFVGVVFTVRVRRMVTHFHKIRAVATTGGASAVAAHRQTPQG